MSHQDKIFNQNGKLVRNQTVPVVRTSSDLCVFAYPGFGVNGAEKINCSEIVCDLSGISFSDIYTATTECFTTNELSGTCFNNIGWNTQVYEDDVLVYNVEFFSSTGLTGSEPTMSEFSGSVVTAFNSLGYNYEFSGTQYTINQIEGAKNFKLEIKTEIDVLNGCPLTGASSGQTFTGSCIEQNNICDIDFSGLTISGSNVYVITDPADITLDITFTANTDSFMDTNAKFRFEVYKYNDEFGFFTKPSIHQSNVYEWSDISGTSAYTEAIPSEVLDIDGDYLVKGIFVHDVCTEFGSLLGLTYNSNKNLLGDQYQLYSSARDYHFVAFSEASEPIIERGDQDINQFASLAILSTNLDGTTNIFTLPGSKGDVIVTLNGLTLAKDIDYGAAVVDNDSGIDTNTIIELSGGTVSGDVLNFIYTNSGVNNNLKNEVIDIISTIPSGTTDNQGSSETYYNTDTDKYEIYTTFIPERFNDVIVTLNGITLANNLDYYQSITNPNRIILEGDIMVGDIINVYYNSTYKGDTNITSTNVLVSWTIGTPPQKDNGTFTLEVSSDDTFTTLLGEVDVDYVAGVVGYSAYLPLVGTAGDNLHYRVKNEKKYLDICGNPLITTKYSDSIKITLQSNAINSY